MSIVPVVSGDRVAGVSLDQLQVADVGDHFRKIVLKQHEHENNITKTFYKMLVSFDTAHTDGQDALRRDTLILQETVQRLLDKVVAAVGQPVFKEMYQDVKQAHDLALDMSFASTTKFIQLVDKLSEKKHGEYKFMISEALETKMKLMTHDLNLVKEAVEHIKTLKEIEIQQTEFNFSVETKKAEAKEANLRHQEELQYKAWYEEMSIAKAMALNEKSQDTGASIPILGDIKNAAQSLARLLVSTNAKFKCTPPKREGDKIIPGTISLESSESCAVM